MHYFQATDSLNETNQFDCFEEVQVAGFELIDREGAPHSFWTLSASTDEQIVT